MLLKSKQKNQRYIYTICIYHPDKLTDSTFQETTKKTALEKMRVLVKERMWRNELKGYCVEVTRRTVVLPWWDVEEEEVYFKQY